MSVIWYVLIPIVVVVLILFFGKPLPVKGEREGGKGGDGIGG